MQRDILILVVFFSFLGVVLAQEKNLSIQVIIDDEQEEHPGSVYLSNPRNKQSTFVNTAGQTQIRVQIDDVLYFQSEFYQDRTFLITPKIYESGKATIHLNVETVLLDVAKIDGFYFTGDLKKDSKRANYIDSATLVYHNLGIPEKDVPPPNPAGQKVDKFQAKDVFTFKLGKIIGEVNGYNRRQRKIYAYEGAQSNIQFIRSQWEDAYYIDSLKIPEPKILEFLSFVYETTDIYMKVKNNHWLEAEEILAKNSLVYLERLHQQKSLYEN